MKMLANLDFSGIDDKSDPVDRNGRFSDVRWDNALADVLRGIVKHLVLIRQRERAVQCQYDPFLKVSLEPLNSGEIACGKRH